jgi:hypothetical protein
MGLFALPLLTHLQAATRIFAPPDFNDSQEQWLFDFVVASGYNMLDLVEATLDFMMFSLFYPIWNDLIPTGNFQTTEWRLADGTLVGTGSQYDHYFTGETSITVTAFNAASQSASATVYVSGGGLQLRARRQ